MGIATVEVIGLLGGGISVCSTVPQLYKCVRTGDTSALSWSMIVLFLISCVFTLVYGIILNHLAIYTTVSLTMAEYVCLAATKLYYEVYRHRPSLTLAEITHKTPNDNIEVCEITTLVCEEG
jgi:uncharacterized protein with PQ loop repeat